jgi:enoyl-CoA hydratase/carnithine racemase
MLLAQIDITDPIGTITLPYSEKRKALSAALIDVVIDRLDRMRHENVRAMV